MSSHRTTTEAVQAAMFEADRYSRSRLELLPWELKRAVAAECDVETVVNLALTGPVFYNFIKNDEASIAKKIVKDTVGTELIHIATALNWTESTFWKKNIVDGTEQARAAQITVLTNMFFKPNHSADLWFNYTLGDALRMLSFYSVATSYASALSMIKSRPPRPRILASHYDLSQMPAGKIIPVPEQERTRFMKVLYLMQIGCNLHDEIFDDPDEENPSVLYRAVREFWAQFASSEQRKVRVAEVLLENYLYGLIISESRGLQITSLWDAHQDIVLQFVVSHGLREIASLEKRFELRSSILDFENNILTIWPCRRTACSLFEADMDTDAFEIRRRYLYRTERGLATHLLQASTFRSWQF
ncbi:hypothetical protein M434DRAFT_384461 [Hypoxylon sp. CO27-5]|nr:hypothetical protein M434DRAFT_384461 [Hypoxylon sp. CO27-5]